MIAPEPFFEPRGTPVSVFQRVRALSALGYEIDLLTYHVGQPVILPGLKIIRIPAVPFIHQVKVGPSWIKPLLDFLLFLLAFWRLLTRRYDAIHSHEEAAYFSNILSALFRTPHVYDMHSSLPNQLSNFGYGGWTWLVRLFDILEKWTLRSCDVVITIAEDLTEKVLSYHPAANQITIENLPLNIGAFSESLPAAPSGSPTPAEDRGQSVVYTGTFEAYQGLELLIDSAAQVVAVNPHVSFVLVGGRPDQIEKLSERIERAELTDHVTLVGTVSPEEAMAYVEGADILISPRIDGTSIPLKVYSYLYAGKPTIATRISAHTQILNEEIALLVEPNRDALANGLLALLHDRELGASIGERARVFAQSKYSFDQYKEKLRLVYDCLLNPAQKLNNVADLRDF